mmetsp:Transcript_23368/g.55646  ORF Transcript_23368/g.55646 Transcript_23368/m.55646 type:complete len:202 (+) Transcript_23368:4660-5265(+)
MFSMNRQSMNVSVASIAAAATPPSPASFIVMFTWDTSSEAFCPTNMAPPSSALLCDTTADSDTWKEHPERIAKAPPCFALFSVQLLPIACPSHPSMPKTLPPSSLAVFWVNSLPVMCRVLATKAIAPPDTSAALLWNDEAATVSSLPSSAKKTPPCMEALFPRKLQALTTAVDWSARASTAPFLPSLKWKSHVPSARFTAA